MVSESLEVSLNTHHPTGTARVTISIRLAEEEREDLINRIMSQQTLLHSRDQVVRALQLAGDKDCGVKESVEKTENSEWEVSLV